MGDNKVDSGLGVEVARWYDPDVDYWYVVIRFRPDEFDRAIIQPEIEGELPLTINQEQSKKIFHEDEDEDENE
jgi:hypothetical protein